MKNNFQQHAEIWQWVTITKLLLLKCEPQLAYTHKQNQEYKVNYYYFYHYCFMALCPGLPGWASIRRNIHPLTPILIINHPLSASSIYVLRSIASSLSNLHAWQTFYTTSLRVLFGLPLGLAPSTLYSIVHTFFHPIIVFFSQHMPIPTEVN